MICITTLGNRIKCSTSNAMDPEFNHLQTNDVYIESLCRSMTDHALGGKSLYQCFELNSMSNYYSLSAVQIQHL